MKIQGLIHVVLMVSAKHLHIGWLNLLDPLTNNMYAQEYYLIMNHHLDQNVLLLRKLYKMF